MSLRNKLNQFRTVCADRRWWPFYLQRRVMGHRRREKLSGLMAARRPAWKSLPHAYATEPLVEQLRGDGLATLGTLLGSAQCKELERYFLARPVHDPYRPDLGAFRPDGNDRI